MLACIGVFILIFAYILCAGINYFNLPANIFHELNRTWMFELFRFLPALGTFFLLFCTFCEKEILINRILVFAPLQYIGVISYEWFLFHYPPAQFLVHFLGQGDGSILVYSCKTLLPFVVTFAFSAFLYHFVSNPVMNWAKIISKNRMIGSV